MLKPLNLIVACSENRVIGRGGKLPWRVPEDFAFYLRETAGKTCILGRISFQTWPRAAQDGRHPIVLTRDQSLAREGVLAAPSFTDALALADALPAEIYVCGGERVYEAALALAGQRPLRLLLTVVHATLDGDTFFPEWRHLGWREISRRESADASFRYTFFTLELQMAGQSLR